MIVKNLIAFLQKEGSVYVEGLGLFEQKFLPAQLVKGILMPPHNAVVLNVTAEESSYAFILFVSKQEQIKIVDADIAIRQWTEQLLAELKKHQVHIERFGTFALRKTGLTFKSDIIPELNADYEGFAPIAVDDTGEKQPAIVENIPIEEGTVLPEEEPAPAPAVPETVSPEETEPAEPEEPAEPATEEEPAPAPAVPETVSPEEMEPAEPEEEPAEPATEEEPAPAPAVPETVSPEEMEPAEPEEEPAEPATEEEKKEKGKSRCRIWIVILLILLAGSGIAGYFYRDVLAEWFNQAKIRYQNFISEKSGDGSGLADTIAIEEGIPESEPEIEQFVDVEDSLSDTLFEADSMTEEPMEAAPAVTADGKYGKIHFQRGNYYVIHGSFLTETECEKHIGYAGFDRYAPLLVSQTGNNRLRVCLGVFDSEEEAQTFIDRHHINKAWILK